MLILNMAGAVTVNRPTLPTDSASERIKISSKDIILRVPVSLL